MKKTWVGLDLRKDGWCLVEVGKRADGQNIIDYQYGNWLAEDAEERGETINKVLSRKVRNPKRVTVSVSLETGFWRHFSLPALPSSMLKEAILTSLEESADAGKKFICYRECPNGSNEKEVDAFLFNQAMLQELVAFLQEAGLKDVYLSPRSCGIINCLTRLEGLAAKTKISNQAAQDFSSNLSTNNYAYIEVSDGETEIGLFNEDRIIFLRSFPNPLDQDQQYNLSALSGELKLLQLMMRREYKTPPLRCYLLGSASGLDYADLVRTATDGLGLEARQVGYPPLYGFLQGLGAKGVGITGALAATGLALEGMGRATGYGIRFKHDESAVRHKQLIYAWVTMAFGVLFVLGGILFQLRISSRQAQAEAALLKEKAVLTGKSTFYSHLQQNRMKILWFLKEWTNVAPEGTVLTGLVIEGSEVKEVSGYTPVFGDLYQRLLASPFLKGLQVRGGISTGVNNSEVFHLAGKLGEISFEKREKSGRED